MRLALLVVVATVQISAVWSKQQGAWSRRRSMRGNISHSILLQQLEALRSFHRSTGMDSLSSDWFFENGSDHCDFTGITCDDDSYVTVLDLQDSSLSGTLPDVFDQLPRLKHLRLYNNSLYGTIPKSLRFVRSLRHIQLGYNFLSGSLPDLSNLPVLSRLYLGRNAISGTIPPSLCLLTNLELLDISYVTKMWGRIPSCFADMRSLSTFRVTDVGLTGTVPTGLCGWRNMNGLQPNPFGCSAIACAAGYFQRDIGRQTSESTACRPCEAPSNVIGTTTCQWHEVFDRIDAPTSSKNQGSQGSPVKSVFPIVQSPRPIAILSSSPTLSPTELQRTQPTSPETPTTLSTDPLRPPIIRVSLHPSHAPALALSPLSLTFTSAPSQETLCPLSTVPSWRAPLHASVKPHSLQRPKTSQPLTVMTRPPTARPTVSVSTIAYDPANERIGSTTGFLATVSLLATIGIVLFLFVFWKRRWSPRGHVRFVDDISIDNEVTKREVKEPEIPRDDSESPVGFHKVACRTVSPADQPNIVITSTAIETVAPTTKQVPSILKTSLTRGQYVATIRNEHNPLEEEQRKVRFTSPVPLSKNTDRKEGRHTTAHQNKEQDDNVWLKWFLNPNFDPINTCNSPFQSPVQFNPETDSVISLNSENSTLSAMLASLDDSEPDRVNADHVLNTNILGIRDRSELYSERSPYAMRVSRKASDIFRSRDGHNSIQVVSIRFSGDESLGEEMGEV